ncbi:relaxase/mobilization nuclease domain-containing protein [Microvirga tunisiensis]|uniref:relaxase/mobilization nuclease domain-containing protein n=1 Tax=Microvirga tunisiensis TaxID=2108360 RepID=UPI003B84AC72
MLPYDRLDEVARSWAEQTGNYQPGQPDAENNQDLTTHIVVSFPHSTDRDNARAAGRAWVEQMFGSRRNSDSFDYVTAFHVDRQHPHLHVVINRRSLGGHWLKISRRHPHLNYNNMRAALVDAAYDNGIALDATSRAERGIMERPITYAEFRGRQRAGATIAIEPQPEPDIPVTPRGTPEPPNLGDTGVGPGGGGPGGLGPRDSAGQAPSSNAGPATRDDSGNDFRMDDDLDLGGRGGPSGSAGGPGQNAEQGGQDEGSVGPQRHRNAPANIENGAQRAASEERARRHRRREPGPEDLDPNQRRRLSSGGERSRDGSDER